MKNKKPQTTQKTPQKAKITSLTSKLKKELFPSRIKYFSLAWIIYIVTGLIIIYAGYLFFSFSQLEAKNPEVSEIKIDKSYIKKLNTLEDFGIPASANEPGFGRENPFGTL